MVVSSAKEFIQKHREIYDLLVDSLTVDGYGLDRQMFYFHTKDMTESERKTLRSVVEKEVVNYYDGVRKHLAGGEIAEVGPGMLEGARRDADFVKRALDSWFHPWTFLAGRMEDEIERRKWDEGYSNGMGVEVLGDVLLPFFDLPEYAPYLDDQMKGFAYNRCVDMEVDYTLLPERLKSSELEKVFQERYPWLVGKKEWDLFNEAYNAGKKMDILLDQKPGFENGYIGGKMSFSSYMPLSEGCRPGVYVEGKRAMGVAFIDYKDCTNTFVIFGSEESKKCVQFYSLSDYQRKYTLKGIHDSVMYFKAQAEKAGKAASNVKKSNNPKL